MTAELPAIDNYTSYVVEPFAQADPGDEERRSRNYVKRTVARVGFRESRRGK
jgi:hypothetical protein